MRRITFTVGEINRLKKERITHPDPRIRRKIDAIFLKSQGISHQKIGEMLDIAQSTLRTYFDQYESGGIEALKVFNYHRKPSPLEKHREEIENDFKKNPPATLPEASSRVENLTGIKRSPKQIGRFLKKKDLNT